MMDPFDGAVCEPWGQVLVMPGAPSISAPLFGAQSVDRCSEGLGQRSLFRHHVSSNQPHAEHQCFDTHHDLDSRIRYSVDRCGSLFTLPSLTDLWTHAYIVHSVRSQLCRFPQHYCTCEFIRMSTLCADTIT